MPQGLFPKGCIAAKPENCMKYLCRRLAWPYTVLGVLHKPMVCADWCPVLAGADVLYHVGAVPQHQRGSRHYTYDQVHHTRGQQPEHQGALHCRTQVSKGGDGTISRVHRVQVSKGGRELDCMGMQGVHYTSIVRYASMGGRLQWQSKSTWMCTKGSRGSPMSHAFIAATGDPRLEVW